VTGACLRGELGGESRDRRTPEQGARREIRPRRSVQAQHDLRTAQRIATELEEVVVGADARQAQLLGEDLCDEHLVRSLRRLEHAHRCLAVHFCECCAPHLAERRLRQPLHDNDPGRHLERRELGQRVIAQLLRCDRRRVAEDDGNRDVLAERRMRHRERRRLDDGRMRGQRHVDFHRRNLEATAVDDLLRAAGKEQEAVHVQIAEIAGAVPAVVEDRAIGLRIVFITGEHLGAADEDFAGRARGQWRSVFVDDRNLAVGRPTY